MTLFLSALLAAALLASPTAALAGGGDHPMEAGPTSKAAPPSPHAPNPAPSGNATAELNPKETRP